LILSGCEIFHRNCALLIKDESKEKKEDEFFIDSDGDDETEE